MPHARRSRLIIWRLTLFVTFLAALSVAGSAAADQPSQRAPAITVSGQTVSWPAVAGVPGYVFVEKVPGQPDRYSDVTATSVTPAPVPGKIVLFSVRTNTPGSRWAPEVGIAYHKDSGTTASRLPHAKRSVVRFPFAVGLVAGAQLSTQLAYVNDLGARTARLEFDIDTPVSYVTRICSMYARAGVRPLVLASFYGRIPTHAQARRLGTWAAAVGPHGTAWRSHPKAGRFAVTDIEFGNETSYGYQFHDDSRAAYASRARTYARRFVTAEKAVKRANRHVGMLAIADNALHGHAWVANMFKAVPHLGSRVAGWTVHPYGPGWARRIRGTISSTRAAGAPSRIPLWVTEWGLSSDGGRCVSSNYGFNSCMSYGRAAATLQSTLSRMRSRFGSRIAAFYLFQASDQEQPGATSNLEGYFGALEANGTPKGAYTAAVRADVAAH
jgi:hypothetical protein